MNFVDDINFIFCQNGRKCDFLTEFADAVNTAVGRGVYLNDVRNTSVGYSPANLTFPARLAVLGRKTVDRFRKYTGAGRFPVPRVPVKRYAWAKVEFFI